MRTAIFFRTLILAMALLCLGWADTWDGIENAAVNITAVKAEFVQEKHMAILTHPFVSKGLFYFKAPGSLRWEYLSPVPSILLMHDGRSKLYTQKDGQMSEETGASLQYMQFMVQDIAHWLKGRFDENPAFAASLEPGRKIVLKPKENGFAAMIQRIELVLAEQPGVIDNVVIYEGENSYTRIKFKNVVFNPVLADAVFQKIS